MFMQGPDRYIAQFAMGLSRKHLHSLTGLLTGHIAFNRHVTVRKICTDPLCAKCGKEEKPHIISYINVVP